jgi:hypothetical protein
MYAYRTGIQESLPVLRGSVAFVPRKAIVRVPLVKGDHFAVACHFGQDGRGSDGQ